MLQEGRTATPLSSLQNPIASNVHIGAFDATLEASLRSRLTPGVLTVTMNDDTDDRARQCVHRLMAEGWPVDVIEETTSHDRETALSLHARALPGPSHNEVANVTVWPDRARSAYMPVHIPPLSRALRIELASVTPALITLAGVTFFAADGKAYYVAPRELPAIARITNGFPFGHARDSLKVAVPAAPLTLTFDLENSEIRRATSVEICMSITTVSRDKVYEVPSPDDALECYREPWRGLVLECERAATVLRRVEEDAPTLSAQNAACGQRLSEALAWFADLDDFAGR